MEAKANISTGFEKEENLLANESYNLREDIVSKTRDDLEHPLFDKDGVALTDKRGNFLFKQVRKYSDPTLTLILRRTNPTAAERAKGAKEEDLIAVSGEFKNLVTLRYRDIDPFWSRNTATVEDIQKLWPDYKPEMTREQINALAPVAIDDARIRIGVYVATDAEGNQILDENDEPIVSIAEKWLWATVKGEKFELSGGKRQYIDYRS